jgi:hypothetical protein
LQFESDKEEKLMSTTVALPPFRPNSQPTGGQKLLIGGLLAVWFAVVVVLGVTGALASRPGTPPLAIGIGFAAPIALFFAALWLSRPFRELVLTADLRLITGIQAWRFLGLIFLALYALNVLPGEFALPAGIGDIAIGLTAPWIVAALTRQPSFAASVRFRIWNALGILDLVSAVGTGALGTVLATDAPGQITTVAMSQLPLALIPIYLVPIFLMLHVSALLQTQRVAVNRTVVNPTVQTPAH